MRILHTSDWHIGKKLNRVSRLDEQIEVLEEITSICKEKEVDLVLISGDIFDTFVPSSEAEELFFKTISDIASPNRAVMIISGNHDDLERLCASRYIASKSNVYIYGGVNPPFVPCEDYFVKLEEAGVDYGIIKKGNEKLYIGMLPYPGEQKLGEKRDNLSYSEKMKVWIDRCFEHNVDNLPEILMSHIFMVGGVGSDGERQIELGGVRVVDRSLIPENCIYTALGHLHKRQVIDKNRNIIYSGSPLQYSFDETGYEKSVTYFEINGGKVENLQVIPLEKGKKLANLVALSLEDGKKLLNLNSDKRVHLTLKLNCPLSDSETKELAGNYPCLTELVLEVNNEGVKQQIANRKTMNDKELFQEYYKSKFNEDVPQDILSAYLSLLGEEEK